MRTKGNSQRKEDGHVSPNTKERVKFQGYINWTPTKEAKLALRELLESGEDPLALLPDILLSGYKLSCGYDHYHQAFSASLYDQNPSSPTSGYNLAQRANDTFAAIARVIFVHVYVFKGDWSAALEQTKDIDEWGE